MSIAALILYIGEKPIHDPVNNPYWVVLWLLVYSFGARIISGYLFNNNIYLPGVSLSYKEENKPIRLIVFIMGFFIIGLCVQTIM